MMRARASASATREVSIVIQRRPHCSATVAVVPEPQVGSSTRSPGSVAMGKSQEFDPVCGTPWQLNSGKSYRSPFGRIARFGSDFRANCLV